MANEEHLALLKTSVAEWNEWRQLDLGDRPHLGDVNLFESDRIVEGVKEADLVQADLMGADLREVNFILARLLQADLRGADLSRADLSRADLSSANLAGADLSGANLARADLTGARLSGANLTKANLGGTKLTRADFLWANLTGANIRGARLQETLLADCNLTKAEGLDTCQHGGPSIVDHRTLQQSGSLPLPFLRGCGLPEALIDYLPSLLNQPIQFYSCFISYSGEDEEFVHRLHADLQNKGVRCWFAPEDMKIGDRILDTIDEAIRLRDKVLLVLSENSLSSDWVEDEVTKAFSEERRRKQTVLFPIRIDAAVMEAGEAWAAKLRDNRHIGDLSKWKVHDAYQKGFDRLLRDLRVEGEAKEREIGDQA